LSVLNEFIRGQDLSRSVSCSLNRLFNDPVEYDGDVTAIGGPVKIWGGMTVSHLQRYMIPLVTNSSNLNYNSVMSPTPPLSFRLNDYQAPSREGWSSKNFLGMIETQSGKTIPVRFLPSITSADSLSTVVQKIAVVIGTVGEQGKSKSTLGGQIFWMSSSGSNSSSPSYATYRGKTLNSEFRPLNIRNLTRLSYVIPRSSGQDLSNDVQCFMDLPRVQPLPSHTFALVLVGGSLQLVHLKKLCCNHLNWWCHSSLSRRDFHSVFHGHVYVPTSSSIGRRNDRDQANTTPCRIIIGPDIISSGADIIKLDDALGILLLPLQQTVSPISVGKKKHTLPKGVYPEDYVPASEISSFMINQEYRRSLLPLIHIGNENKKCGSSCNNEEKISDTKAKHTNNPMPVGKSKATKPLIVHVHPCHFVCRVHVGVRYWGNSRSNFSTLHLMPGEGARIAKYADALRALPLGWEETSDAPGSIESLFNVPPEHKDDTLTYDTPPLTGLLGGELVGQNDIFMPSSSNILVDREPIYRNLAEGIIGQKLSGIPSVLNKTDMNQPTILLGDVILDRLLINQMKINEMEKKLGIIKGGTERFKRNRITQCSKTTKKVTCKKESRRYSLRKELSVETITGAIEESIRKGLNRSTSYESSDETSDDTDCYQSSNQSINREGRLMSDFTPIPSAKGILTQQPVINTCFLCKGQSFNPLCSRDLYFGSMDQ